MTSKLEGSHGWISKSSPSAIEIQSVLQKLEVKLKQTNSEEDAEDFAQTIDFLLNIKDVMEREGISSLEVVKRVSQNEKESVSFEPIPRKSNEQVIGGEHGLHAEMDASVIELTGQSKLDKFAALKNQLGTSNIRTRK